ncbi:family 20 glycosylhydrolase [Streptomyces sp. NPDC047002]|uniref:family 20 glycosylhydrolase n=1 Tax=Streptomyces sp. NPDC047002 TaxID=3155475 RepID=UPI003452ECDA
MAGARVNHRHYGGGRGPRVLPGRARAVRTRARGLFTAVAASFAAALLLVVQASAGADAAPAPAAAPAVLPSLHGWSGGAGSLRLGPHTRIATDAADAATARMLAGELRGALGARPAVTLGAAHRGDIALRTDRSRAALGAEGYALGVTDRVTVTGRGAAGVFYGTRTVLQLLTAGRPVPRGSTVDVPSSGERAVGVCACYTYVTDAWLTRLVKDMAYLKLNTLHLELKVKSSEFPAVNTFSYYTPGEVRGIVALAARYHITVVPEINSPGHMDPYLTPYPDLQLKDRSGAPDPTRLDITNPAAFTFFTRLVDADLALFPGPSFHMGADEYMIRSAYGNYPQLLAYAREKYGPGATAQDAYVDFVNRVDAYVRARGRTLRIWNDGLTGENTVPLDKDIVVEHWLPEPVTSQRLLDEGYRVVNATDAFYYVRGGYRPDARKLYEQGWTPADFADGRASAHRDRIPGAEYLVWPDNYGAETENQTQSGMYASLRVFAQGVWGGARPAADYAGFAALAEHVGHAPGRGPDWSLPVADGTYTIRAAAGGGPLGAGGGTGAPLTAARRGGAAPVWRLTATDDGYYRLVDAASGRCADVARGAVNGMKVVEETCAAATAETCSAAASQKWQLEPVSGGYRLVDAITQQALTVRAGGGAVVQRPRDTAARGAWRLMPAGARPGAHPAAPAVRDGKEG